MIRFIIFNLEWIFSPFTLSFSLHNSGNSLISILKERCQENSQESQLRPLDIDFLLSLSSIGQPALRMENLLDIEFLSFRFNLPFRFNYPHSFSYCMLLYLQGRILDWMKSRVYISQFSAAGFPFNAGYQGSHVRIYDVDMGWKVMKDIFARNLRWTDTSLSSDQHYLVYSIMSPIIHMVNVRSATTESIANVTIRSGSFSLSLLIANYILLLCWACYLLLYYLRN